MNPGFVPRIRSIYISNYKSIEKIFLELGNFNVLVGANGTGKSNFIDALSFINDCVSGSLELAIGKRGGIGAVRRISGGHPTHIGMRLLVELSENAAADYRFEISAKAGESFSVSYEHCLIENTFGETHEYKIINGRFEKEITGIKPLLRPDRLALYAASSTDEYRPLYDFLSSILTYSIEPEKIREFQDPESGDYLKKDGGNAAAVLKRLIDYHPNGDGYELICDLLGKAVAGIEKVEYKSFGSKECIRFKQDIGLDHPWVFDASSMSDGTLRILGILLAVFQRGPRSVLAIEEPEATVHPAVTEIVTEVLFNAADRNQIILTTHSPDILDYKYIRDDQIKLVTRDKNKTKIALLSQVGRDAIRRKLYTAGELLRLDEFSADQDDLRRQERVTLHTPIDMFQGM